MGRRKADDGRPDDTIWRDGKLTFKKRWPTEVRERHPSLGEAFHEALGTSDVKAAKALAAKALTRFLRRCEELTAVTPQQQRADWLASLTDAERGQVTEYARRRLELAEAPDNAQAAVDLLLADMAQAIKYITTRTGRVILRDPHSPDIRVNLLQRLNNFRNDLAALKLPDDGLADVLGPVDEATKPLTLRDACDVRLRDIADDAYKGQILWAVKLFQGIVGDRTLAELRTVDLSEFETKLRGMPSSTSVRNSILKGKTTVLDAIKNAAPDTRKMSPTTIAKQVGFIKTLASVAFSKGLAGNKPDPFASFPSDRVKKAKQRKEFVPAELDRLFAAMETDWLPQHKDRVWICLLALYHGLRREEICQLRKGDIQQVDGIYVLNVTTVVDEDDEDDKTPTKRLKTDSATRVVPIHQRIIGAGFIEYVQASPGPLVFASLTPDRFGRLGVRFGKRFGELRTKAGIVGRRTLVFHSFRHTAITAMREAEWPDWVRNPLSGHTSGSVNDTYGRAAGPKAMKPYVDKLEYKAPAVDRVLATLAK